ncbi:hypothetical protein J2Y55_004563 [Bosea sp. BE125]|nr:hypothetical protein [Bosea sp. BE125]
MATKIGRSAITGRFTTKATAAAKPTTHIIQTIKTSKPSKR